jgi:hypothetical protein
MACSWQEVHERYWTVCYGWGFFPYPCRRYRDVTRWCCLMDWIKRPSGWGRGTYRGCANGVLYTWRGWNWSFGGALCSFNKSHCFTRDDPKGTCGDAECIAL